MKVYRQPRLGFSQQSINSLVNPNSSVLEMGCATGYMTRHFQEEMGCRVTALDISEEQAELARPFAERVIVGDLSDDETWQELAGAYDHVIYADVLEHLANPWLALERTKKLLKPDGTVIASIPNIAYYKIRKQLLLGRFDYTESGIMDDTHLRFFTEKTARDMFARAGYEIVNFERIYQVKTDRRLRWLCPNAFAYQFVIKGSLKSLSCPQI
ncbi:MAG: class I SAM-dependent methyltransferase [Armatimonadota bacterium]